MNTKVFFIHANLGEREFFRVPFFQLKEHNNTPLKRKISLRFCGRLNCEQQSRKFIDSFDESIMFSDSFLMLSVKTRITSSSDILVVVVWNSIHSGSVTNRTGNKGLFLYYLMLLYWPYQLLAMTVLSQLRVSIFKTVRPRAPCCARCMGHTIRTWSAVCSMLPHSQFGKGSRPHLCMHDGIAQHQSAGG